MPGRDRRPSDPSQDAPAGQPSPASSALGTAASGPASPSAAAGLPTGRYAYDGLERVIHERARLSILSSLAGNPHGLAFNDLKQLCHLTDGNLSRQVQLLQETGFVEVIKGTKNNRPHTQILLTETGRDRFLEYIAVLESVVADAESARVQAGPSRVAVGRLRGAAG